jgi:hypothetical protein
MPNSRATASAVLRLSPVHMITSSPRSCRASIAFGVVFLDWVGDRKEACGVFVHGNPDDRLRLLLQMLGLAIQILGNADTRFLDELPLPDAHGLTVQLAGDDTSA